MSKIAKVFAVCVLCAGASLSISNSAMASELEFLPTYDQCMSWCMVENSFFTCDAHCRQYPSSPVDN